MIRAAANAKQSKDYYKLWHQPENSSTQPEQQQWQEQQRQHVTAGSDNASQEPGSSSSSIGLPRAEVDLRNMLTAECVTVEAATALLPGLSLPAVAEQPAAALKPATDHIKPLQQQQQDDQQGEHGNKQQQWQQRQKHKQQQKGSEAPTGWSPSAAAALHAPGGITLHPQRYMAGLWAACQQLAAARGGGRSSAVLHVERVDSLQELLKQRWEGASGKGWDGVVVAAGAGVGTLGGKFGELPLDLCQGCTLDLMPGNGVVPEGAAARGEDGRAAAAAPLLVLELVDKSRHAEDGTADDGIATDDSSSSSNNAGSSSNRRSSSRSVRPDPEDAFSSSGHSNNSRFRSSINRTTSTSSSSSMAYPASAPSILGQPYLASQGGEVLVLGASKEHGWSSEAALGLSCVDKQDQQKELMQMLREGVWSGGEGGG